MKKFVCLLTTICIFFFCGCSYSNQSNLTKVTLNEVAHSVFYTPLYVAIQQGYFEEEGIDLTLVTGFGSDKTMTALLSGDADIAFMGPETTIYTYNSGANDQIINFAQLTQRAGNFLISRSNIKDFSWSDLQGKTVIGGRKGGMPEMVFEYILKKNHLDPSTDLTILQNIDFGSTGAAFSGGQGDFSVEFEPSATTLETQGEGYVVASLGVDSGFIPYTAFSTKSSYLAKHPEVIQSFTNALQKGMNYINTHTSEETAKIIAPQFKEIDLETLTKIITRYSEQNTWDTNLIFEKESYELLLDVLQESDELSERPPYDSLVNITFAEKALKE